MSGRVEEVPFGGWKRNLRLSNGAAELVATLEVGPRVLSYSRAGGASPFQVVAEQAGGRGEPEWRSRGGHRLWLAPEGRPFSYFPDNHPVAWERLGELKVRLTPPPESVHGVQKQMDLALDETTTRVTATHRLTCVGKRPVTVAPWALTVMAPGGVAVAPQPPPGEHPRDLLPDRSLVLWPYTDLADPRWHVGRRFLTLRQDPQRGPTKIGLDSREGWCGYYLDGAFFLKRFPVRNGAPHPDRNCNFEMFSNGKMLELESLGPLATLEPGQSAEHVEEWELHDSLPPFDPRDDASIAAALGPVIR